VRRITVVAVASAAALVMACEGNGSTGPNGSGLGCTSFQGDQNLNNWSNCLSFLGPNGAGSGSNGNGNGQGAPAALYRLIHVNGDPLPFTYGTPDSVVTVDSTRIINFQLDSSVISLNTDSTVVEIDYHRFRDFRQSTTPPPNFNVPDTLRADTSFGVWTNDSASGQPVITLLVGYDVHRVAYIFSGDTLTANYAYNAHDEENTDVPGIFVVTYQKQGSPFVQMVRNRRAGLRRSTSPARPAPPVRQSRVGGPSLSLVGSDYRGGRLVRVVGQ
jgi:hypothetical protein